MNVFEKEMTYRGYIKYLIPSIFTMIFLSFYTTIDGFFVSKYVNSDALAGINIVIPITCIIFGVSVMFATGSGAIIGEFMGKRNQKKANETFSLIALVLFVFSIIFTIFGIMFLKPIAIWLGTSEKLMEYVLPYAFMVFLGTIPMAFKLFFEYLVRTDGNSVVGLAMSMVGLVLNVVFDYYFVGFCGLGTFGAALGTVISISCSTIIGLICFLKFSTIKLCKFTIDFRILWKSCTNGCSEMLTELSTGITTLLFNIIVMRVYGEDGVAAVTILMYIYYFFIAFYMGIAVATAPMISYNLGAKNYMKIKKLLRFSFITIIVTAILIMGILYVGKDFIIKIFIEEGHVYEITKEALFLFSPLFLFNGINVFLSSYFTAIGDGVSSAIISTLRSLVFVVLFLLVLPIVIGVNGIWVTIPFAEICTIVIAGYLYNKKGIKFTS